MLIPIVFISDDNYSIATSVAIESIIQNKNKNSNYKIYILGIDISDQNKNLLESQSKNNVSIEVLNLANKYQDITNNHPYITNSMFYKFDIANIFNQYDKIIYLDGDVIVNGDLSELFNIDLKDNYAGVVKDLVCFYEQKQHLELKTELLFNSGVMLLNLTQIRNDNLYEQFINTHKTNNNANYDQEVLNIVFNQKIKLLPLRNNFINTYYLIKDFKNYTTKEYNDFKSANKNPLIIHYAGDKPWNLKKGQKFNVWQKYFKKSPYKNHRLKYQKEQEQFKKLKDYNFIEKIFSIKNEYNNSKKYKVICFLGAKLKIPANKIYR